MEKFDPIDSSYLIMFVGMLQIWNLMYSMYIWIIKNVGLELIIFSINVDVVSCSKVFNTINSMFLSIVLLT